MNLVEESRTGEAIRSPVYVTYTAYTYMWVYKRVGSGELLNANSNIQNLKHSHNSQFSSIFFTPNYFLFIKAD